MALMWPRKLPSWVEQDPRRRAEREVYRQLELVLDDSWSVYYSKPWWGISKTGAEEDGEADFIVAHPGKGVLFLEVKGGGVGYDPKTDHWISKDSNGIRHRIKDPVQQAMKCKHKLLRKFQSGNGWPRHRVRLRHGVVFPDCESRVSDLIGNYERELFCCATEFRDRFACWLNRRLASHVGNQNDAEVGPGTSGIAKIDATIAAPARLTVPLHRQLTADIARQDELLTGAQLNAIMSIEAFPRAVVEGAAGTGKTVIACELAVRYAKAGLSTLLCCLSEALATSLKRRIPPLRNLDVLTLSEVEAAVTRNELLKKNAVIIDEGQDVDWQQWEFLERLVATDGIFRVLFDTNQAVYRARDDLETRLQAFCFPLRLNLRNTKRVAEITEKLYRGPLIACAGPEGRRAIFLEVAGAAALDKVLEVVGELVGNQNIPPDEIAVLVPDAKVASAMRSKLCIARMKATDAIAAEPKSVIVEAIARFKGLEAAIVVVLADRITANNTELSYVAVSRARALLVVVGPITGTQLGKALESSVHDCEA